MTSRVYTRKNSDGHQVIGSDEPGAPSVIITDDQSIEPVVAREMGKGFDEKIALEAFMQERVSVEIHETTDENLPPNFLLNVNGLNQLMFRGQVQSVRRMFIESLARCKETKYRQEVDPIHLEKTNMVPRHAYTYPFNVINDTPKGKAWLAAIRAEPA